MTFNPLCKKRQPMIARTYLTIVALLYFGLSMWCTFAPAETSQKIGFTLNGGSGKSEYMTVYGGLEFGLALVLIVFAWRPGMANEGVLVCVLIHAALVLFRTASLFWFSDVEPMTWKLAAGEWAILLLGLATMFYNGKSAV
jgi:hypothetical protein